ncbi:MAG: hypothetical protein LBF62_13095 [Tannerellaceae bacterium]|jgi:hypothetical protein|nr:hypothetical protein [Tannerellaceae bacterium]
MTNEKILALHPAPTTTGYAIHKYGKFSNSGIWELEGDSCLNLLNKLYRTIGGHGIERILIPDILPDMDARIPELIGVIKAVAQDYQIPVTLVHHWCIEDETPTPPPEQKQERLADTYLYSDNPDERDAIAALVTYVFSS